MKKLVRFAKAEATGNDFVIFDGAHLNLDALEPARISKLCDRNFGIGGDGAIMIRRDADTDFRFSYYNADGRKSTMCGNGSRAAVLTANILGLVKRHRDLTFLAEDGIHRARIASRDEIRVEILADQAIERYDHDPFALPGKLRPLAFLDTGVPHLVLEVPGDLGGIDVDTIGRKLRNDKRFAEGTNVNFVQILNAGKIRVRTYERGVGRETLSCGTGVTASALACWQEKSGGDVMSVETRGGMVRVIRQDNSVFLEGPARVVFVGQYLLNL